MFGGEIMKRFLFNLIVAGSALFLCACQASVKTETAFFRDFNLGATVEQMKVAQLRPTLGSSSGGTAFGETTEREHVFNLEYLLDRQNGAPFDEAIFLNRLQYEIAGQISKAGARANGSGSSGDIFYFNYSAGENRGSIDVIGARVEGNKYKLWCVVRESAGIKSDD
jgi:hypothetical protein